MNNRIYECDFNNEIDYIKNRNLGSGECADDEKMFTTKSKKCLPKMCSRTKLKRLDSGKCPKSKKSRKKSKNSSRKNLKSTNKKKRRRSKSKN